MNWGKGLALALVAFAVMMAWFVVMAARNPSLLVTEEYYEKELVFQERIDRTARASALSAKVHVILSRDSVRLVFPAETDAGTITGELILLRPNDPRADRTVQVGGAVNRVFRKGGMDLWPGRYNAALEWTVDGVDYFMEEKLVVQ